jgi:hypothetical protein
MKLTFTVATKNAIEGVAETRVLRSIHLIRRCCLCIRVSLHRSLLAVKFCVKHFLPCTCATKIQLSLSDVA